MRSSQESWFYQGKQRKSTFVMLQTCACNAHHFLAPDCLSGFDLCLRRSRLRSPVRCILQSGVRLIGR
ncbi:hypothetical protein ROHU_029548 [Labeo rohita]|uniref:Uncharacterized protein n=1 Tax=Labeo rohita TaxID=84645 RepID=A0A498LE28_LABRO|nr:hypothetical protein ROHU_032783 [Labeo rohita]RXN12449.1 hypothetical protein ROHU_029548 [Labeo rohita]